MKIDFVLANSADPDEILPYAAFHLGVHCLPKHPFRVSSLQRVKFKDNFSKNFNVLKNRPF